MSHAFCILVSSANGQPLRCQGRALPLTVPRTVLHVCFPSHSGACLLRSIVNSERSYLLSRVCLLVEV